MNFLEYRTPDEEAWRIESADAFLSTFGITGSPEQIAESLKLWHGVLCEAGDAWTMICRLYAINPLLGVDDSEELRPWAPKEVAEKMKFKGSKQVDGLLADAVDLWQRWMASSRDGVSAEPDEVEDVLDDVAIEKLLLQNGFTEVDEPDEREFIAGRLRDLEEWLENANQRAMARSLVMQEVNLFFLIDVQIGRLRKLMRDAAKENPAAPGTSNDDRMNKLMKTRADAQSQIESTMKALGISESQTGATKRKKDYHFVLSSIHDAIVAYESKGDKTLIDGMHTAAEVEILTRPLDLRPMQYRPDIILYVPAIVAGLMDENFELPTMSKNLRRRLLRGFNSGLQLARSENGETIEMLDSESGETASEAVIEDADEHGDVALSGRAAGMMDAVAGMAAAAPPPRVKKGDQFTDF